LRARITLTFTLGAFVTSTLLAGITYFVTRSSIVGQEINAFEHTAVVNARDEVAVFLRQPETCSALVAELGQIDASSGADGSLIGFCNDNWVGDSTTITQTDVPVSLRDLVLAGGSGEQTFDLSGTTHIAVGVAVQEGTASVAYIEVFNPSQVSRTLRILFAALLLASIITTTAGAVLGRWAATRALRPLRDASRVALAIASGRLDARLQSRGESDLDALVSSFNQMVDRLRQRIEREARFTSDVSHELRSPMTTLATALSVMEKRRDELPDRSRQALDLLSAEIRRFQRMLADLLEISRFDAGPIDFEASIVKVGELVRRAVGSSNAIPVIMSPDAASREIAVDKRRFERIISNLLENAERHAGGALRVVVEARELTLRFAIEDGGPGVAPGDRERIFERFARGAGSAGARGAGQGTGLGLALVHEHVKLHGGNVFVEDAPNGGARFVIVLPLEPERLGIEEGNDVDQDEDFGDLKTMDHMSAGNDAAHAEEQQGTKEALER
jgi:signal transduction histidine kinase